MSVIYAEVERSTHWAWAPPAHAGDDATLGAVDMDVLHSFEEVQIEGEPDLIVELIDTYLKDAPRGS